MSAYVALEKGSIAPYWPSLTQILCAFAQNLSI